MKTAALLLMAMSVSINVLADTQPVKSVSLYEPPKSATINTANARLTPNQWQPPACMTCEDVADIQTQLIRLGYRPGRVDGIIGPITMAAIKAYQSDHNLPADGQPTDELLERLKDAH